MAVSGALVFAAGSSASQTVVVSTVDDSLHEGGEGFALEVFDPSGVAEGGSAGTVIADDDPAPVSVSLSVSQSSLPEAGPAAEVTVTAALDGTSTRTEDTIVEITLGGAAVRGEDYSVLLPEKLSLDGLEAGAAVRDGDYSASLPMPVTIPAGSQSGSATVRIDPAEDGLVEGDEAIVVSGTVSGAIESPGAAQGAAARLAVSAARASTSSTATLPSSACWGRRGLWWRAQRRALW